VKRGITPKYADDGDVIVINQRCIRNHRVSLGPARRHNLTAKVIPAEKLLEPLDVLVNSTGVGTLGRVAQIGSVSAPITADSHVSILRVGVEDVDKKFFGWCIKNYEPVITSMGEGSTGQTELSRHRLGDLTVSYPPLEEQRRIAAVLGALDDKIELNRKKNRTLEEIAQAIFKSWFIDFDGVPPEDLVDSELGPIPKGWKVDALDEVADYLNGTACQKYPAPSDEPSLPVIKIRELNQGVTKDSDRATVAIPDKWRIADGDVLFSWSGSLIVKVWTGGPGALNQHLFKVTSETHPRWLYLMWTRHHLREFQRIAADKATTMGHIKRRHLTEAKCVIPPAGTSEKANTLLGPLVERQVVNDLESRTLAALRDTLLPKLISGELRVPKTEELEATA